MKKNYIVCAALQLGDTIIAGPRHFDRVMRTQIRAIAGDKVGMFAGATQGFVDKFGNFLLREEAMVIAQDNDQNIDYERNGSKTKLFSEGLY